MGRYGSHAARNALLNNLQPRIAMKCLAGCLGHASHVAIDAKLTLIVSASAVLGSFLGGYLTESFWMHLEVVLMSRFHVEVTDDNFDACKKEADIHAPCCFADI